MSQQCQNTLQEGGTRTRQTGNRSVNIQHHPDRIVKQSRWEGGGCSHWLLNKLAASLLLWVDCTKIALGVQDKAHSLLLAKPSSSTREPN